MKSAVLDTCIRVLSLISAYIHYLGWRGSRHDEKRTQLRKENRHWPEIVAGG